MVYGSVDRFPLSCASNGDDDVLPSRTYSVPAPGSSRSIATFTLMNVCGLGDDTITAVSAAAHRSDWDQLTLL